MFKGQNETVVSKVEAQIKHENSALVRDLLRQQLKRYMLIFFCFCSFSHFLTLRTGIRHGTPTIPIATFYSIQSPSLQKRAVYFGSPSTSGTQPICLLTDA